MTTGMPLDLGPAAQALPAFVRVLLRRADGVVAEIDGLVAGFWRSSFDLALARELRHALVDACARREGGPVLLTGFDTTRLDARAFANDDVRAELVALARAVIPRVRGYALVVEGTGFAAAALRAGSAGITLLARPQCSCRTFRDLALAADWALPLRPSSQVPRAAVLAALRELRASVVHGEFAR